MTVKELLKEFADEVHKGKYERLSYKDWARLRQHDNEQCCIAIGLNCFAELHTCDEILWIKDPLQETSSKTFSDFLEVKWLEHEALVPPTTLNIINENETIFKKENKSMKNTFNFNFGPCTNSDNIHLSPYGIAVKNSAGTWVSYNTKDASIIDVDIFNFNASKYLFKMPVALKDIKVGDVLIHNNKPVFVLNTEKSIYVVDPTAGEKKEILLTKNMFGFDFATKVTSLFSAFDTVPTTDSPFGNMLPFLMIGEGGSEDIDPFVMYMMMQQTGGSMNNPMMLYFLMNHNDNSSNLLPLMFMMNQNNSNSPA